MYIQNQKGALTEVTGTISRIDDVEIHNLKVLTRTADYIELMVDVGVPGVEKFKDIIGTLRASPVVSYVNRKN